MGIYHCKCKQCGNEWDPVRRELPRRCPQCKSKNWNIKYWANPNSKLIVEKNVCPVPSKVNISEKKPIDKCPEEWYKRYAK